MARVSYWVLSKKNPAQIYLRFIHGSKLDVFIKSDLFINPKHWDKKKQRVKNMAEATQKDLINATLEKLSIYLIEQMNKDHISGHIIDKSWARNKVADFFGGVYEKDKAIAVTEWIEEYIEKAPTLIKKNKDKPLSQNTLSSYKTTLSKIKDFQDYKNTELKFTDIHLSFHKEFIEYLSKVRRLNTSTIGAIIKNLKALCRVAKLEGLSVHKEIDHPEFFVPRASSSKTESVYLSDEEIDKIYDLDLSANASLDNVRDCAIVGLRTGLRVSDFLKLDAQNIKGGYIEVQTQKTGHKVVIPLHVQLKSVLDKRDGLPRKISDVAFNQYFKEVCKLAGIAQEMEGFLMNPKTRRKEEGVFPKYKLVSSHTCRRSFATNLYGKLPNLSIMAITGHKTEKQFLEYIKITPREHAEKLKALWERGV